MRLPVSLFSLSALRRPAFWTGAALLVMIGAYFTLLGGSTWDYTRALIRQGALYAFGLYLAGRFRDQRLRVGPEIPGRKTYQVARVIYDLSQLLLLQIIYRNYVIYLAPDQRDPILLPALSTVPVLLSFALGYFRNRVPRRLYPLITGLLFLAPPLSLSIVGEVGLTVSSLVAFNFALHFRRPLRFCGPLPIRIAVGLILFSAAASIFVTVDRSSTLYYWHQTGVLLLLFFYTLNRARVEIDLHRVGGVLVSAGMVFAVWLAFQEIDGIKDLGGVNLNTVAILFEVMLLLSILLALRVSVPWLRIAFALAAVVYFGVQLTMQSRAGYGALGGTALLLIAVWVLQRLQLRPFIRGLLISAIFVSGVAAAYVLIGALYSNDPSVGIRYVYWQMAFEGFQSHPLHMLFGTGDTGPTYSLYRFPVPELERVLDDFLRRPWHMEQHPHSDYVALLYGYGLVGFAGFAILVFFLHFRVCRARTSLTGLLLYGAIMTQWLHGIADCAVVHYFNAGPMWFCIAMFLLLGRQQDDANSDDPAAESSVEGCASEPGTARPGFPLRRLVLCAIFGLVALGFLSYTNLMIRSNALIVTHVHEIAKRGLQTPLSTAARTDLGSAADRLAQMNSWLPFLDRNLNLEAELRYLLARQAASEAGERRQGIEQALELICAAVDSNNSPIYLARAQKLANELEALPGQQPVASICNQPADEFARRLQESDPYEITRIRPWLLPLR